MRGTDLTEWQIKAAEKFVRRCGSSSNPKDDNQQVSLPFGDLVRLVAWYGQIRAAAVASGAPPDEPGETYVVSTKKAVTLNTGITTPYSSPEPKEGKVLAMSKSDGG